MNTRDDIERLRTALRAALDDACDQIEAMPKSTDWLDAFRNGDMLLSDEAAMVANRSPETIRRWAADCADAGTPIALNQAGAWLICTPRLLQMIEATKGLPARREAESRLKYLLQTRPGAQKLPKITAA